MAYIYAISDPHGALDVLKQAVSACDLSSENKLMLLGDYIPHQERCHDVADYLARCEESLTYVRDLCEKHPEHVIALKGNHEYDLLERVDENELSIEPALMPWLRALALFYETDVQIFVHAGIDEEAGEWWKWGTNEEMLLAKYPTTLGHFEKDIISGHTCAYVLAGSPEVFQGIFWDGESHYVIDGTTEETGELPILRYNTQTCYYDFAIATSKGVSEWQSILPPEDV